MMRMPGPSRVLVYEYFSGGGFAGTALPGSIAAEALAMLWALLADFRGWGAVHTVTVLDPRFENYVPGLDRNTLPADEVLCTTPDAGRGAFLAALDRCDAALVVAPETDGILSGLSAEVESSGKTLLGSGSSAVELTGDKETCGGILENARLPTPRTATIDIDSLDKAVSPGDLPVVVKPADGVGAGGVCLVCSPCDAAEAAAHIRRATSCGKALIQPYVEGIHASVSLLAVQGASAVLSLNRQLISPGMPFRYHGSVVPFEHEKAPLAAELACEAVRLFEGLRGYVGVDIVIAKDSVQLIEINPRLTTSYIGLRQAARVNPAMMIYDACARGVLPGKVRLTGRAAVRKEDPASWGLADYGQAEK